MRHILALTAFVVLPSTVFAACPGQTQLELNQCAQAEFGQADADLNAAWRPAKAMYDSLGQGALLLDAQRKWISFRDAACAAETAPFAGGSIRPLIHWTCMTRLTRQRTHDLRTLMQN